MYLEGYFQFGLKIQNQTIALNFSTWIKKYYKVQYFFSM